MISTDQGRAALPGGDPLRSVHRPVGAGLLIAYALGTAGCVHFPERDPLPDVPIPETYLIPEDGDPVERWWELFDDPQLADLVDQALNDNFNLRSAWARLEQADAMARQAQAAFWPRLTLDATAGYSRSIRRFPTGAGGGTADVAIESGNYGLSLGAAYEVDIWGKVRHRSAAAGLDLDATGDAVDGLAITVAASISETWFALISGHAAVALLAKQLETNRTLLELIRLRYGQGLATSLDVRQQQQQVAASQGLMARARGDLQIRRFQLAAMIGLPPGQGPEPETSELPYPPPMPGTGLPGELIVRRPDVRAAQRRLVAADHRVGAAIADLLPSLRLSANAGFSYPTLPDLFSNLAWSVLGNLTQTLFEGGRRMAEVDRTEAVLKERVNDYNDAVITALHEVERALVLERQQDEQLKFLKVQQDHARSALDQARQSYGAGLTDFLRVLTALQALQRLELTVLEAHRQLLSFRIQLYRALGGTWTQDLVPPGGDHAAPEAS